MRNQSKGAISDWPATAVLELQNKLRSRERDDDLISDVLASALGVPFGQAQRNGGFLRYGLAILRNKRADRVRVDVKQRAIADAHLTERTLREDRAASAHLRHGEDDRPPAPRAAPPAAGNIDNARVECERLLGKPLLVPLLKELKALRRRRVEPERALRWLITVQEIAPTLRRLERLAAMSGKQVEEPEKIASTLRETLEDAWDELQLVQAVNLRRGVDLWLQSEEGWRWLERGLTILRQVAEKNPARLLTTMKGATKAVAEHVARVADAPKELKQVSTVALLAIAAGLEDPTEGAGEWRKRCARLKKALQRARRQLRGQKKEKSTAVP